MHRVLNKFCRYLVLANMLTESQINPFDSQETKPYKNDREIEAMTNLVSAYQKKEINEFEHILKGKRNNFFACLGQVAQPVWRINLPVL